MSNTARLAMRSVTYALEGRDILSNYGISATVVRLRPSEGYEGCSFGLEIPRSDIVRAENLLKKAQIDASPVRK